MPFPSGQLLKVVISGQINDVDRWSINPWFLVNAGSIPTTDTLAAVAADFATDFGSNFWGAATSPYKAVNAAATTFDHVKVYQYDDGVLTNEADVAVTSVPGTSGNAQPAYCAQVFSLRTAAFGRTARGRLYLPRTGVSNSGTTLQYTNTQAHVDHMAAFLASKFRGPSGNTSTAPRVVSIKAGIARNVTLVVMDSKPDTQRGRESKQAPTSTMVHTVP